MVADSTVANARLPRTWTLRNPRNGTGDPPLTAGERHISPHADLIHLVGAIVAQAVEDLDAGYERFKSYGTANQRYWRAQAYIYFFHGNPTGFERFTARLGIEGRGRFPDHPLFDDAAELERRRVDLAALALPPDLFDRRIAELRADSVNWNSGQGDG